MDTKRFTAATLVGGLVLYAVGYLMFVVAFGDFYAANAGSATGVDRTDQLQWAAVLASLAYAALIVFAMGNRADSTSTAEGAKVGAIVGFLLWFTVDLVFYSSTNIANLTRTLVDPVLEIVHGGVGGAAIALVLSRVPARSLAHAG